MISISRVSYDSGEMRNVEVFPFGLLKKLILLSAQFSLVSPVP